MSAEENRPISAIKMWSEWETIRFTRFNGDLPNLCLAKYCYSYWINGGHTYEDICEGWKYMRAELLDIADDFDEDEDDDYGIRAGVQYIDSMTIKDDEE